MNTKITILNQIKLIIFMIGLVLFVSTKIYAQVAPGGIYQSSSAQVNGVEYVFYEDYDNTPENGITGTVKNSGYLDNLENPDDLFLNEDGNTFSLVMTSNLQIDMAGDYNFRALNTDDAVAILIDGVVQAFGSGTVSTGDLTLTAGLHSIEIRFSENIFFETVNIQYDGPDSGNSFGKIPDNKLFIDRPEISVWYKSNVGACLLYTSPSPRDRG